MNSIAELARSVEHLQEELAVLRGEAEVRRLQARYMGLCDTPCPMPEVKDVSSRIELILDLYTEDAAWEGVVPLYTAQFGTSVGKPAIRRHFDRFFSANSPALVFNTHYLTSEKIEIDGERAQGQWLHIQPWIFADGYSVLRSSRLDNLFRRENDRWLIAKTRTQGVFIADLPKGWATYAASQYI